MSSVRALDDQPGSGGTLDTVTREAAGAPGAQASPARGSRGTGLVIGLLSAAAFGTSGTFGTSLIGAGWSPAGAVLARVSIAALVLTGPALVQLRGRWTLLRRWGWRTVAYGCVGVAACQLGYFNAISRMPVGIALLIEYMGILLVVGWLWVRHGQRPRRLTIAGSAAAIGGLALMLDLSGPGGISRSACSGRCSPRSAWRCTSSCPHGPAPSRPMPGRPALRHPALRHPALRRCRRWS